ncbi:hypothetical protein BVRB_2g040340 [Beta vulgaris subsp. vulgaris]|nr:hypothetical protein BVRB_2g040340 [Beta vulgaris subsp. vulgaris]
MLLFTNNVHCHLILEVIFLIAVATMVTTTLSSSSNTKI